LLTVYTSTGSEDKMATLFRKWQGTAASEGKKKNGIGTGMEQARDSASKRIGRSEEHARESQILSISSMASLCCKRVKTKGKFNRHMNMHQIKKNYANGLAGCRQIDVIRKPHSTT
jgi:hypothetical protein